MAKRSRTKSRQQPRERAEGEIGPRQPCPCGSGRRYKHCHGAPGGAAPVFVNRPFEGLPSECDVVALRELVPAATAPLPLGGDHADRDVTLVTLLPGAAPAMVRENGAIWLALQVQHHFGDPGRDLGAVLTAALAEQEPGVVGLTDDPGEGPRLQDLVAADELVVTVHEGFDFWVADVPDAPDLMGVLEQANASVHPTERLTSVSAAYWTDVGTKEHLRWVMPEPEERLLDALARLHVAGDDVLVPDSRLVGMFRAHGLLTPVWDLPRGTGAEALEEPADRFAEALEQALADESDLTGEQRAARNGLAHRQVTIR
jgi:hypothetical protein